MVSHCASCSRSATPRTVWSLQNRLFDPFQSCRSGFHVAVTVSIAALSLPAGGRRDQPSHVFDNHVPRAQRSDRAWPNCAHSPDRVPSRQAAKAAAGGADVLAVADRVAPRRVRDSSSPTDTLNTSQGSPSRTERNGTHANPPSTNDALLTVGMTTWYCGRTLTVRPSITVVGPASA